MNYSDLKTEITTDPKSLGYAALETAGNTAAIANLMNLTTGSGAGTLTMASIPHDAFVAAILPILENFQTVLATLSAAKQTYYNAVLQYMESSTAVYPSYANTQAVFGAMVGDGLLTAAEVTGLTTRACSRAEVLFGEGTTISQADVMSALGVR